MIDLAERLGADHLVTGHYARIVDDGDGPLLAAAADAAKDQSYMLAALPPGAARPKLRFPLTELSKPEVREIAARHGLAVARKPESQDLCFLAGQGKRRFLRRHGDLREHEGAVLDRSGPTIGRHRGHHNFTVGQRRGIGVSAPGAALRHSPPTPSRTRSRSAPGTSWRRSRGPTIRDAVLHRERRRGRRGPAPLPIARRSRPGRRRRRRAMRRARRRARRAVRRRRAGPDGGPPQRGGDRRPRNDRLPRSGPA